MAALKGFIEHVEGVMERGYAYVSNGSVYFDYGKWNFHIPQVPGWSDEAILRIANATLKEVKPADVRTHGDFCLWYGGEDSLKLQSPWGPGEPGTDIRRK